MIALNVAKLKIIFAGKRNFSSNKAKKTLCGKFGSIPTFRSTRKGKKCFCDEPASAVPVVTKTRNDLKPSTTPTTNGERNSHPVSF